jgi:hypothetical protein
MTWLVSAFCAWARKVMCDHVLSLTHQLVPVMATWRKGNYYGSWTWTMMIGFRFRFNSSSAHFILAISFQHLVASHRLWWSWRTCLIKKIHCNLPVILRLLHGPVFRLCSTFNVQRWQFSSSNMLWGYDTIGDQHLWHLIFCAHYPTHVKLMGA